MQHLVHIFIYNICMCDSNQNQSLFLFYIVASHRRTSDLWHLSYRDNIMPRRGEVKVR